MALQPLQLDNLSCSLCSEVLKDPATIPCGHSFCFKCIDKHWTEREEGEVCTCPTCATTFKPKPVLVASATFAALVEELTRLQTAVDTECYATNEDTACDVCKGKKFKSVKSCLVCRASYCEVHLQPHYESPAFLKHQLVPPCKYLAQSICPHHNEVLKMYCHTDQQVICFLCSMDEHKTHKTVSAATERIKKLDQLELVQEKLQQIISDKEKDIAVLKNEMDAIVDSANTVISDSENILREMARFIEKSTLQLKEHIRHQQEFEVSRLKKIQEKMEGEILELRGKHSELNQLANVHDYGQFFDAYQSIPHFDDANSLSSNPRMPKYFANITLALSKMRDKLRDMLAEECDKILRKVPDVDVLLPAEPNTRLDFLQYSVQMTLDPNSAHARLFLSNQNRKVTVVRETQCYANHPDRFLDSLDCLQVLSKHGVTGRSYWEIEIGKCSAIVAISYKSVSKTGERSIFGSNDKSWALNCFESSFYFMHNDERSFIAGPRCEKVGVYVDVRAGTLSFYGVGESMVLLHTVDAEFTEPLYAGLGLYWVGDSVQMC
ncbi:hypothetical protein WMY93_026583 [Mugilogobius chulae]|uniref:Tripartite motif-containing protein 16 n=1 Tax=Mugilogobius chulae TaxID=88201 RepID=A0AAW0NAK5_9GOBI